MTRPEPILWLSDSRGVYIPQNFAESFVDRDRDVTGVSAADWEILETGPDHEWYWEAWDDVLDNAIVTDHKAGVRYRVEQDGDCWLIPVDMEWDDEKAWYVWPEDEQEVV